ncbi:N-acyltransferase YncA [Jannaschia seosinensis]|uniref:N-acyltransferase YncA n=1 Tax=Jannaschia seosinensis TaxID=313367 RepID=A0A0M7BEL0_9RHOB|nr:GNAT family N-acetyltransferase [Jannaschia seosinensis]CUH40333.1 N-acyltransferase YncA [Jannaschia seosinensis]
MTVSVRPSREADTPAITRIYAGEVTSGFATFEEIAPDAQEMADRRAALLHAGMPYLVAVRDSVVIGYAYAGPWRARPAYRHSVETSVYVAPECRGLGAGRALMSDLIARCEAGGWRQMVAVIGDSGNAASIALHGRLGFRDVGTLRAIGFKHGRWVDTVIMQRPLGRGDGDPPERPF